MGGFIAFGEMSENSPTLQPIGQRLNWQAKMNLSNVKDAAGITIEFLLKPTKDFLRGGSAFLLKGAASPLIEFSINYASMAWNAPTATSDTRWKAQR